MHTGNIENYNFLHGLHRNMVTGKWFPLHPHTLGRPLTHDEMDYNLLYSQQTLAGWRIFGQNEDLTLSDGELTKSLIFWKISESDIDYNRYVAAGYAVDQYIWITPLFDCNDFIVSSGSVTDTSGDTCEGFIITMSSSTETTDSCDIFGISASGSTNSTSFLPTATPEPTTIEPTATGVPPTATPEPTSTATPVLPTPTPTEVIAANLIQTSNPDLEIWYDASDPSQVQPAGTEGQLITQWNDKSALAHNASPIGGNSKPAYDTVSINGLNAISFNGTSAKMSVSPISQLTMRENLTVFMVLRPMSNLSGTLLDTDGSLKISLDSQRKFLINAGGANYRSFTTLEYAPTTIGIRYKNTFDIPANDSPIYLSVNNGSMDPGTFLVVPPLGQNLGPINELFIGTNVAGDDLYNGKIGEILIFTRALTNAEMSQVSSYLQNKWSTWQWHTLMFNESASSAFDDQVRWKDQILSTMEEDPFATSRSIYSGTGYKYIQKAPGTVTQTVAIVERYDGGIFNSVDDLALVANVNNLTYTKRLLSSTEIEVTVDYTSPAGPQFARLALDENMSNLAPL